MNLKSAAATGSEDRQKAAGTGNNSTFSSALSSD